jgi:hypothetical protein
MMCATGEGFDSPVLGAQQDGERRFTRENTGGPKRPPVPPILPLMRPWSLRCQWHLAPVAPKVNPHSRVGPLSTVAPGAQTLPPHLS